MKDLRLSGLLNSRISLSVSWLNTRLEEGGALLIFKSFLKKFIGWENVIKIKRVLNPYHFLRSFRLHTYIFMVHRFRNIRTSPTEG